MKTLKSEEEKVIKNRIVKMELPINKILEGDALSVLKTFPDECIDMCMTSPPYFRLRNYNIEPIIYGGIEDCEHEFELIGDILPRINAVGFQ